MGAYINVGNKAFERILNSEYVDKTGLIAEINATLNTERACSCVSRCRRFGKSMATKMLAAYYDESCDSRELFHGLEIEHHASFEKHLNKYPVIYVDMTTFTMGDIPDSNIVPLLKEKIKEDVLEIYADSIDKPKEDLMELLLQVAENRGKQFIMIIDEWDAICRERKEAMDEYVMLLRRMFKNAQTDRVFAGVYMTGILPIKKYATESALNNFWEYSMILPSRLARYFGFTKDEVKTLCGKYSMDFDEMANWYDGYCIGNEPSMFNPNSVMKAIYASQCATYWASTGAFSNIARYIGMNFDGLRDDIVSMIGGGHVAVNCTSFGNDPAIIDNKDEVLTLLIHLGYLAYDSQRMECYIPNKEVAMEMENAVRANNWHEVMEAIGTSKVLMEALLDGEAETVAAAVEKVHQENTSIIAYNNENSLSCVLTLAFYSARNNYVVMREMPTGKGFADLVFIPRRNVESPAVIIELKWKENVDTAISQIKRRQYPQLLQDYAGEVLLCGISYDRETKKHSCVIEKV